MLSLEVRPRYRGCIGLSMTDRTERSFSLAFYGYRVTGCSAAELSIFGGTLIRRSFQLAPSTRVLAYLVRNGRFRPTNMALTTLEQLTTPKNDPEIFPPPPPKVVTTPCDPWPRPYYIEDELRKVHPYHYTYNTYCKERWRGRELIDIFATEFRDRPHAYYVSACLQISQESRLIWSRKTP